MQLEDALKQHNEQDHYGAEVSMTTFLEGLDPSEFAVVITQKDLVVRLKYCLSSSCNDLTNGMLCCVTGRRAKLATVSELGRVATL